MSTIVLLIAARIIIEYIVTYDIMAGSEILPLAQFKNVLQLENSSTMSGIINS